MYFVIAFCLLACLPHKKIHTINNIINNSVYINCKIGDDVVFPVGSGTNVRLDNNYIITAKHVMTESQKHCEEISYCYYNSDICIVIDKWYSSSSMLLEDDIALILSNRKGIISSRKNLNIGDEVLLFSRPWGEMPSLSDGFISSYANDVYLIDSYSAPGSSGGGIFLNGRFIGVIVAINVGRWGPETNRVYGIHYENY